MPHADDFRTLAEIAIALAGFTGIVVALNGRSPDGRSPIGSARLRALLLESLGVVFFAFMPSLVDSALQNTALTWRISQLGFALYHLLVLVIFFRSTGLAHVAQRTVLSRSSQIPFAILLIILAVAGATTTISAQSARAMWPILCSSGVLHMFV